MNYLAKHTPKRIQQFQFLLANIVIERADTHIMVITLNNAIPILKYGCSSAQTIIHMHQK